MHLFGKTSKCYSSRILETVERSICNFRFFTTTDEYIKIMFNDYWRLRETKPLEKTKAKIAIDAEAILTGNDLKEFREKWK